MSESFSVGEIVIFVPDMRGEPELNKYAGEVEVIAELDPFFGTYDVQAADGWWFHAMPCVLHRRPQPPDWNSLSTPVDTPRELETV